MNIIHKYPSPLDCFKFFFFVVVFFRLSSKIRFIRGFGELQCRLAECAPLGQRRNAPWWAMGGLRQGLDDSAAPSAGEWL